MFSMLRDATVFAYRLFPSCTDVLGWGRSTYQGGGDCRVFRYIARSRGQSNTTTGSAGVHPCHSGCGRRIGVGQGTQGDSAGFGHIGFRRYLTVAGVCGRSRNHLPNPAKLPTQGGIGKGRKATKRLFGWYSPQRRCPEESTFGHTIETCTWNQNEPLMEGKSYVASS